MPSSYVNNLRLEEMATGEKSGTWGTITNTNLELIGEALGYGTEDLASDADATITMQDATSDGIRSMYLKITSSASLTTTRTITIAPNTVSKVWIIENATTGSQSIAISQGSGANVTIPSGAVKVIYTDGAGAGAAVVDALTGLSLPNGLTVQSGGLDVTGDLTVDTDTLAVDSTNNKVGIGTSSPNDKLHIDGGDLRIQDTTPNIYLYSEGAVNNVVINANISDVAQGGMSISENGNKLIQSRTNYTQFFTANTERMRIDSSGNVGIGTSSPSTALDVAGTVTADGLTVDGDATFGDNDKAIFGAGSDLQIYHNGANSYIDDTGTGNLYIRGSDTVRLQSATGEQGVIVTTDGAVTLYHDNGSKLATTATGIDVTGTVVSDGLTVASDSTYAVDVSRPSAGNTTLRITSGSTAGNDAVLRADIANTTGTSAVYFGDTDTNGIGRIMYEHNGDYMRFYTSSTEKVRITSAGNVGIGTTSPAEPLDVVGTVGSNVSSTGDFNFKATSTGGGQYRLYPDDATTANPTWLHQTNSAEDQAFVMGGVERVRFESGGNVGIGTSSPLTDLVTVGTSMATSQAFVGSVADTSYSGGIINLSNTSRSIGITADPTNAGANSIFTFSVDGTEHMRIDSNGDVFWGTTSDPDVKDESCVTFEPDVGRVHINANSTAVPLELNQSAPDTLTRTILRFHRNETIVGSVTASTTGVTYNTSSDYRLKEDLQSMSGSVDRVKALNPVNFAWKVDGSRVDGFLAHEAQTVVPEAVTGTHNEVDAEGNPVYQGIDQSKLVPLLTAALQEAITKIEALEARVTALESN